MPLVFCHGVGFESVYLLPDSYFNTGVLESVFLSTKKSTAHSTVLGAVSSTLFTITTPSTVLERVGPVSPTLFTITTPSIVSNRVGHVSPLLFTTTTPSTVLEKVYHVSLILFTTAIQSTIL